MSTLQIRRVRTKRDLRRFIEYPCALDRHDPHWVAPLLTSEWAKSDLEKNHSCKHARIALSTAAEAFASPP